MSVTLMRRIKTSCKIPQMLEVNSPGNALLKERDMTHELLKDFDSPFVYGENLYPEVR